MNRQTLPARETVNPAVQPRLGPARRILVAEDEAPLLEFTSRVLSFSGCEVDTAADGAAAWQALNSTGYDLLITDNDMPNISGIDLLKKLRAARLFLPVIMATGAFPEQEFIRYPWLRPDATLLKPYTIEDLLGTVEMVLREAERAAGGAEAVTGNPIDQRLPTRRGARDS